MKLYHFTSSTHVESIQRHGIRQGMVPLPDGRFITDHQWLTGNPAWVQGWSRRPLHTADGHVCDRTEARFTVTIPKARRADLVKWTDFARALDPAWVQRLHDEGGQESESWWLFSAIVKPGWLRTLVVRP